MKLIEGGSLREKNDWDIERVKPKEYPRYKCATCDSPWYNGPFGFYCMNPNCPNPIPILTIKKEAVV